MRCRRVNYRFPSSPVAHTGLHTIRRIVCNLGLGAGTIFPQRNLCLLIYLDDEFEGHDPDGDGS
jgi:hypothetical protein